MWKENETRKNETECTNSRLASAVICLRINALWTKRTKKKEITARLTNESKWNNERIVCFTQLTSLNIDSCSHTSFNILSITSLWFWLWWQTWSAAQLMTYEHSLNWFNSFEFISYSLGAGLFSFWILVSIPGLIPYRINSFFFC